MYLVTHSSPKSSRIEFNKARDLFFGIMPLSDLLDSSFLIMGVVSQIAVTSLPLCNKTTGKSVGLGVSKPIEFNISLALPQITEC